MSPVSGLNATFASTLAGRGRVAFIGQSGALITAILDWSLRERVGFSSIVSLGSMADVGWGDLIDHLGDDPETDAIVLYMETVGDARAFLSATREVALAKPVIVMKPGRTAEASRAAASHTGSLTGSDEVLDAALPARRGPARRAHLGPLLLRRGPRQAAPAPRPAPDRAHNAGGPGVLATDTLIGGGGKLAELAPDTMAALDAVLPPTWSHGNPVDIIGDAPPERYAAALEVVTRDPGSDGLLVILTPQAMTDPTRTAQQLVPYASGTGKPILASWMGGLEVEAGDRILREAGVATFPYPDSAAQPVHASRPLRRGPQVHLRDPGAPGRARETRGSGSRASPHRRGTGSRADDAVGARIEGPPARVRDPGRRDAHGDEPGGRHRGGRGDRLSRRPQAPESTRSRTRPTSGACISTWARAPRSGRPIDAIKASVAARHGAGHMEGVSVQPMIGGGGIELIIGSSVDPQFGPVLLFGLGGELVEVFRDRALGLPPLTTTLARRMMESTRVHEALKGVRGRAPVDLAALEGILVRVSELVVEQPAIAELDINPLLATPERLVALDARVILHDRSVPDAALPRPAIRPYPLRYVGRWTSPDGEAFLIRPIRPEDESLIVAFHRTLSAETVYQRYFANLGYDAARRARPARPRVLHRLRPRDRARRRARGPDERGGEHRRRRTAHPSARPAHRRDVAHRQRRLPAPWSRARAPATAHRGRAGGGPRQGRRRDPRGQRPDDRVDAGARVRGPWRSDLRHARRGAPPRPARDVAGRA